MKALSLVLLLMASLAFVLMGCSDNSGPVVPSTDRADASGNAVGLAKGAVVHSVTGNGNIWIEGKMGVLTVNGQLYADGSVKGEFNLVTTAFNPEFNKLHGKVVALAFYENYSFSNGVSGATALFWWREQKYEGFEGKYFAAFAVDHGQAPDGSVADWTSPNVGPYDAVIDLTPDDIATMYPDFFVPIDVGNVTIR